MDPDFYENQFQPLFMKMAVINLKHTLQKKYPNNEKYQYDTKNTQIMEVLKVAVPAINKLVECPDITVCQAISDTGESGTINNCINNTNTVTNTVITIPATVYTRHVMPVVTPLNLTLYEEPTDVETIKILDKMDTESAVIYETVQQSRWITVYAESEDEEESESESKDDSEAASIMNQIIDGLTVKDSVELSQVAV